MELQTVTKKAVPKGLVENSYMLAALSPNNYDTYTRLAEHILQKHDRDGPTVPHVTVHPPTTADCTERKQCMFCITVTVH